MTIQVACPSCQKNYNLSPKMVGKRVRCKACQTDFPVPTDLNGVAKDDTSDEAAAIQTASTAVTTPPAVARRVKAATPVETADEAGLEDTPAPAKSKTWLFVLIGGVLAVFLLFVVVAAGGIGAWLLFSRKTPAQSASATNTEPTPSTDSNPDPITKPDPKTKPDPITKPDPKTKPNDPPVVTKVAVDPLPEPIKAPTNPRGALPLPSTGPVSILYPSGPSPIVAVPSQKTNGAWDVWNLQNMKQVGTVTGTAGGNSALSPDGMYLACTALGPMKVPLVDIYTVADGRPLRQIQVANNGNFRLGLVDFVGPDRLLTIQQQALQGQATVWNLTTGEKICSFTVLGSVFDRTSTALSPGRRYLAVQDYTSDTNAIRIHDLATGAVIQTIGPKLARQGFASSKGVAFSNDGKKLAVLFGIVQDNSDRLLVWDLETGKRTVDHKFATPLTETANKTIWYPVPLEWLPDGSGWFVYGQLMIDYERGHIFWTIPPETLMGIRGVRRILDSNYMATVNEKMPQQRQLEIIALPKEQMEAARKK